MSAREQAAVEELQRLTERLAAAETRITELVCEAQEHAEHAAANAEALRALLDALDGCGVEVKGGEVGPFHDGEREFYWWAEIEAPEPAREALADAMRGGEAVYAEWREANEDPDPPFCEACDEPATWTGSDVTSWCDAHVAGGV